MYRIFTYRKEGDFVREEPLPQTSIKKRGREGKKGAGGDSDSKKDKVDCPEEDETIRKYVKDFMAKEDSELCSEYKRLVNEKSPISIHCLPMLAYIESKPLPGAEQSKLDFEIHVLNKDDEYRNLYESRIFYYTSQSNLSSLQKQNLEELFTKLFNDMRGKPDTLRYPFFNKYCIDFLRVVVIVLKSLERFDHKSSVLVTPQLLMFGWEHSTFKTVERLLDPMFPNRYDEGAGIGAGNESNGSDKETEADAMLIYECGIPVPRVVEWLYKQTWLFDREHINKAETHSKIADYLINHCPKKDKLLYHLHHARRHDDFIKYFWDFEYLGRCVGFDKNKFLITLRNFKFSDALEVNVTAYKLLLDLVSDMPQYRTDLTKFAHHILFKVLGYQLNVTEKYPPLDKLIRDANEHLVTSKAFVPIFSDLFKNKEFTYRNHGEAMRLSNGRVVLLCERREQQEQELRGGKSALCLRIYNFDVSKTNPKVDDIVLYDFENHNCKKVT
jgi:hypothetical protein